jgi:Asp-tRNA(Asn)/Glu-tRNA(Gln) amidotransferase A subunit family amidase
LADAVRTGTRSAVSLVEESLRRIEAARDLNAVVALRSDDALREAARIDARLRSGDVVGPLSGLPLLVKDIEDVRGMRTTFGSLTCASDPPARRDGAAVAALRKAGAVCIGKANVPEFAFQGYTDNRLYGATRNPWDPAASPGGSSGGSGAALAAGLVAIATATDVGGSIRIPAALCGLIGLKPTQGRTDRKLASPRFNVHGPLAATVDDAGLLLDVLAGAAVPNGSPLGPPFTRVIATPNLSPGRRLETQVDAAFREAAARLAAELGRPLEQVAPGQIFPSGYDVGDWFRIVGYDQVHAIGGDALERHAALFDPVFLSDMRDALDITELEHAQAIARAKRYRRELSTLLGTDAVLVTPTLGASRWLADGRLAEDRLPGLPGWVFNTEPVNLTGHPAVSMPTGTLVDGLPAGLQVIGPVGSDRRLLDIATRWESAVSWALSAPGYLPFGDEA